MERGLRKYIEGNCILFKEVYMVKDESDWQVGQEIPEADRRKLPNVEVRFDKIPQEKIPIYKGSPWKNLIGPEGSNMPIIKKEKRKKR